MFMYRSYVYSPPGDEGNDTMLSYCLETSCYNNLGTNSSDMCNSSYCEMKTFVPTVPDIDNHYWLFDSHHWFFDFILYIGGTIHLTMSLGMVISYFLINVGNFILPDFICDFLKNKGKYFLPGVIYKQMYVKLQYTIACDFCICRAQDKRTPTYSDEPLFGIRPLYHIVRVNNVVISNKPAYYYSGRCL